MLAHFATEPENEDGDGRPRDELARNRDTPGLKGAVSVPRRVRGREDRGAPFLVQLAGFARDPLSAVRHLAAHRSTSFLP